MIILTNLHRLVTLGLMFWGVMAVISPNTVAKEMGAA